MKTTCDHCGKAIPCPYDNGGIVWCAQCVRDNVDLLVGLDVIDREVVANLMKEDQYSWGQVKNLVKLSKIPPWDFAAAKEESASEPVKPKEKPLHIEEPKFDFAAYNGLTR
jgi:hypothetical protein